MKIKLSNKTGMPDFILEKKDIIDAEKVRKTMNTPGWQILTAYLMYGREAFIDAGKNCIKNDDDRALADVKWAILKGFDEYIAVPQRIIARAEEFQEAAREAEKNDGTNGEQQFNGE